MGIKIKVLYFAKVKEILNKKEQIIEINNTHDFTNIHIKDLFDKIIENNLKEIDKEKLKEVLSTCLLSKNDEYLGGILDDIKIDIKPGDLISVIPPISAG